jgi:hypothetical protein
MTQKYWKKPCNRVAFLLNRGFTVKIHLYEVDHYEEELEWEERSPNSNKAGAGDTIGAALVVSRPRWCFKLLR